MPTGTASASREDFLVEESAIPYNTGAFLHSSPGHARIAGRMPQLTYFLQTCPTCGRASQVRVEYLGTKVSCRHCGGTFAASGESADLRHGPDQEEAALDTPAQKRVAATKKPR